MYKITYQKSNGEIFDRIRNTLPIHSVGETTSMGWKILNIQWKYNKKFYSYADYNYLVKKEIERHHIYLKFKKAFNNFLKQYVVPNFFIIPALIIIKTVI